MSATGRVISPVARRSGAPARINVAPAEGVSVKPSACIIIIMI